MTLHQRTKDLLNRTKKGLKIYHKTKEIIERGKECRVGEESREKERVERRVKKSVVALLYVGGVSKWVKTLRTLSNLSTN